MTKPGILLTENNGRWQICGLSKSAPVESLGSVIPKELATKLISFANQHALRLQRIIIAVSSESVLYASLPSETSVDIKSNRSLRYTLEAVLPVDAEGITADTIQRRRSAIEHRTSAVAIEFAQLLPWVEAIEQANARVQFIVPRSILVLQQAHAENILPHPSVSLWMLDNQNQVEMISLRVDGTLENWQVSGLHSDSIQQHLSLLGPAATPVCQCGTIAELERMDQHLPFEFRSIECDPASLARKAANRILSGHVAPWCDLRRDQLAMQDPLRRDRRSLTILAIAFGIFVATVCSTFLLQAKNYQSLADEYKQKQTELFRSAFPKQRAPAAILARIKSEHTKAKGVRKTDPSTTTPRSALDTLHRVIGSLNEEFPFEVEEIRIESGRIALEIELLTQQDAGKVAAALAKNGFDVEPPSTTLINSGRIKASIDAISVAQLVENPPIERGLR